MGVNRRQFLGSSLATAVGVTAARRQREAGPAPEGPRSEVVSSFDPWVELHRDNLLHNVREISRRVERRPILAVIKNNGYGMGVTAVAGLLEPLAAIHGFAVVKLQEAVALRDAGITKPILLMGPFDERDLEALIARSILPMVYTPIGDALDRLAAKRDEPVPLHVCVDTGIGRVGVPHREAARLVRDLVARPSVRLRGIMMTFAEAEAFDDEQKRRFDALCTELDAGGVALGMRHAASSFALFQHPDYFLDMVRPGMAIYGVYSEQAFRNTEVLDLRPALALKARVAYVKRLEAGESAGYGRAYNAERPVWVATLPMGHTDGVPRVAAGKAKVRVGSRLYPVIASVSASHTIIELGAEKSVSIGDEVSLFDWQSGSRPEDVSAACGASVYDLTMHLNPLLPRRIV